MQCRENEKVEKKKLMAFPFLMRRPTPAAGMIKITFECMEFCKLSVRTVCLSCYPMQ